LPLGNRDSDEHPDPREERSNILVWLQTATARCC
jgi:hypothetical protein